MRVTPERMKELEEWTAEHAEEIEEQRRQLDERTQEYTRFKKFMAEWRTKTAEATAAATDEPRHP